MQPVDLLGPAVRVAGIAELEPTPAGIVVHRMPAWARTRHNDLTLGVIETMPAGARLECTTAATRLELDVQLTLIQLDDLAPAAAFDLVVDGALVESQSTLAGTTIVIELATQRVDFVAGGPTTITFTGLPAGDKHVEIWLPHAAAVQLLAFRADAAVRAPATSTRRRWVHSGSSISHCMEAAQPTRAWPAVAARLAGVDLRSFAFAGQCQLDPFVGRMIAEIPVDLVSLKLGINIVNGDTMRERTFVPAVHGLLDTIRDQHPDVPIVVVTPIVCPVVEDHPGPTSAVDGRCRVVERPAALAEGALTLLRIRALLREIVAARGAGDPQLTLLEGTDLFGPADVADLPDGLHPNAAGYERMGRRFHALAFGAGGPFAAA